MGLVSTLKSDTGLLIISILLGIAVASLFQKRCNSDSCAIVTLDPHFNSNEIIKRNDKCFKYQKVYS